MKRPREPPTGGNRMDIGRILPTEAAAILNVSPQFVRVAMQQGKLPIGTAVQMSSIWTLNKVREWLLYAVTKAEKELGGGTGQIKLRYVYDMFVARFTWLARVISFEAFSIMVDEALERMKKMLESNKAMQTLVSGEAGETVEKDM